LDGSIRVGSTTQVKSRDADSAGLSGGSKQSGAESADAGEDSNSGGSSSGCAVRGSGSGMTLPWVLLATLALLRGRRRHHP